MIGNIPLTIDFMLGSSPGKVFYYGNVAGKPCYKMESANTINLFWSEEHGCWIFSVGTYSWNDVSATLIPPGGQWAGGYSTGGVITEGPALTLSGTFTGTAQDVLETLPPTLGTMRFNSEVVGWISDANEYQVLLHPTSKYNLSGSWKLQSRDSLLGFANISDYTTIATHNPPPQVYHAEQPGDVVAEFLYTVTAQHLLALPNMYGSIAGSMLFQGMDISMLDTPDSYYSYISSILSGGKTITPNMPPRPGVYTLSEIYIPSEDYGRPTNEISELYIPRPGSIVNDISSVEGIVTTYIVDRILDTPEGPESVLIKYDPSSSSAANGVDSSLVNIANNLAMAFYTEPEEGATHIVIDSKITALAAHGSSYRLSNTSGAVISATINGVAVTYGAIPISIDGGVKVFDSCVTNFSLSDGQTLLLQVLNSVDVVIGEITIYAKEAAAITDLQIPSSPIVELSMSCGQSFDDNNFYLYSYDTINTLDLVPRLLYADGSSEYLSLSTGGGYVRNIETGVVLGYGFDTVAFDEGDVGKVFTIGFKYYIPKNTFVDNAIEIETGPNGPFISREYTITIVHKNHFSNVAKIALIPNLVPNAEGDADYQFEEIGAIIYWKDRSQPTVVKNFNRKDALLNIYKSTNTELNTDTYELSYMDAVSGPFTQTSVVTRYPDPLDTIDYQELYPAGGVQTPLFTIQNTIGNVAYGPYGGSGGGSNLPCVFELIDMSDGASIRHSLRLVTNYTDDEEFYTETYLKSALPGLDTEYRSSGNYPRTFRIRKPDVGTAAGLGSEFGYLPTTFYMWSWGNSGARAWDSTVVTSGDVSGIPDGVHVAVMEFYDNDSNAPMIGVPITLIKKTNPVSG